MDDFKCTWEGKDLSKYSFKNCKSRLDNKNIDKRIATIKGLSEQQILSKCRKYKYYGSITDFIKRFGNKLSQTLLDKIEAIRRDKRREAYYKYDSPVYAPKHIQSKSLDLTDQDYINKIDKYSTPKSLREFIKKSTLSPLLLEYAKKKLNTLYKREYKAKKQALIKKVTKEKSINPKVIEREIGKSKYKKEQHRKLETIRFTSSKTEIVENSKIAQEVAEYKEYQANKNKMLEDYLAKGGKITNLDEVFGTSLKEYWMWIIYILIAMFIIAIIPAAVIIIGGLGVIALLLLGISKAIDLTIQDINDKD